MSRIVPYLGNTLPGGGFNYSIGGALFVMAFVWMMACMTFPCQAQENTNLLEKTSTFTSFSPDGKLAAITVEGKTHIVDAVTGKLKGVISPDRVIYITFSPDSSRLAAYGVKGMYYYDISSEPRQIADITMSVPVSVFPIFSQKGDRFLIGYVDRVCLYDTPSGKKLWSCDLKRMAKSFDFSNDGKRITGYARGVLHIMGERRNYDRAAEDNDIYIYSLDPEKGTPLKEVIEIPDARGEAYLPGEGIHLALIKDNKMQLWNIETGKAAGEPVPFQSESDFPEFNEDGSQVLYKLDDYSSRVLNTRDRSVLGDIGTKPELIDFTAYSADSKLIYAFTKAGAMRIWDAVTLKPISDSVTLTQGIKTFAWSGSQMQFAILPESGKTIHIYDVTTRKPAGELTVDEKADWFILNKDASRIISQTGSVFNIQNIRLWDVATGKEIPMQLAP